jgi:hypothetical protein
MIPDEQDAFGHQILDHYNGLESYEIVERDDGLFNVVPGTSLYFSEYED